LLKTGHVISTSDNGSNPAPPNDTDNWEQIESYNAIYSDIGLFNQALVGKAVFNGEFMFSQEPAPESPEGYTFEDFTPISDTHGFDTTKFIPALCFNFVTGET